MSAPAPTTGEIARFALSLPCTLCGVSPGDRCPATGASWKAVCKARFIEAAIEVRNAWKAENPSAETLEACARHDLATEQGCFMREVDPSLVTAAALVNRYGMAQAEAHRTVTWYASRYTLPHPLRFGADPA